MMRRVDRRKGVYSICNEGCVVHNTTLKHSVEGFVRKNNIHTMVETNDDERVRRAQEAYSDGSRRRTILVGILVGLVFVVAGGVTAGIAVRR